MVTLFCSTDGKRRRFDSGRTFESDLGPQGIYTGITFTSVLGYPFVLLTKYFFSKLDKLVIFPIQISLSHMHTFFVLQNIYFTNQITTYSLLCFLKMFNFKTIQYQTRWAIPKIKIKSRNAVMPVLTLRKIPVAMHRAIPTRSLIITTNTQIHRAQKAMATLLSTGRIVLQELPHRESHASVLGYPLSRYKIKKIAFKCHFWKKNIFLNRN